MLYFALIALISMSKFDAIFLDLCKSPEKVFRLYLFGILETQGTAYFLFDIPVLLLHLHCLKGFLCLKTFQDLKKLFRNNTKDHTYNNLKRLIKNKNLCVLSGDKDSCVIIMNKQDYIQKLEGMLDEGIKRGTYERSTDPTKHDLETLQRFLYRNFKNHPSYDKMRTKSSQPEWLYAAAKTHKFNNLDEITVEKLKFRPVDQ